MTKTLYMTICLLLCLAFNTRAQQIEHVDFSISNDVLTVTYDLSGGPKNTAYDVRLIMKTDSADIEAYTISGDVNYVVPGTGKRIEWKAGSDKVLLQGRVQAMVKVTATHSTKITGGPQCAFLSVLLPGLGDQFVDRGSAAGGVIAGAFITAVSAAIVYKGRSNDSYRSYHSATDQDEINSYYANASSYNQKFQFALGAAAVIWAADIIYVAVKGFHNRNLQRTEIEAKRKKAQFTFSGNGNKFQIGFIKNF